MRYRLRGRQRRSVPWSWIVRHSTPEIVKPVAISDRETGASSPDLTGGEQRSLGAGGGKQNRVRVADQPVRAPRILPLSIPGV